MLRLASRPGTTRTANAITASSTETNSAEMPHASTSSWGIHWPSTAANPIWIKSPTMQARAQPVARLASRTVTAWKKSPMKLTGYSCQTESAGSSAGGESVLARGDGEGGASDIASKSSSAIVRSYDGSTAGDAKARPPQTVAGPWQISSASGCHDLDVHGGGHV